MPEPARTLVVSLSGRRRTSRLQTAPQASPGGCGGPAIPIRHGRPVLRKWRIAQRLPGSQMSIALGSRRGAEDAEIQCVMNPEREQRRIAICRTICLPPVTPDAFRGQLRGEENGLRRQQAALYPGEGRGPVGKAAVSHYDPSPNWAPAFAGVHPRSRTGPGDGSFGVIDRTSRRVTCNCPGFMTLRNAAASQDALHPTTPSFERPLMARLLIHSGSFPGPGTACEFANGLIW
jgi:hypothetical protein